MDFRGKIIIAFVLALTSNLVMAGSITDTYTAGDTLTAAKMDSIKAAVNDNDARLSSGAVSVHGNAFKNVFPDSTTCTISFTSIAYSNFTGTGTGCDAVAPIQFPDGVTLTSLNCSVFDNDATAGYIITDVTLRRIDLTTQSTGTVFTTISSADIGLQTISDATTTAGVVDNSRYAYILWWDNGNAAAGSAVRLYGCSVPYS